MGWGASHVTKHKRLTMCLCEYTCQLLYQVMYVLYEMFMNTSDTNGRVSIGYSCLWYTYSRIEKCVVDDNTHFYKIDILRIVDNL